MLSDLRDRIQDPNVWRIYKATFGLGLAYGMAISLLSLFLAERQFPKDSIGSLAAWFASGIVLLSLPMGALIERFTAKRTLVFALAGYAFTVTVFPFLRSYEAIAAVRLLDGACSVGVWISSETILLSRAGTKNKAFVTSLYAIVVAIGYVAGPLLARLLVVAFPFAVGFVTAGVIALAASIYVARTVDAGVSAEERGGDSIPVASPAGKELEPSSRIRTVGTRAPEADEDPATDPDVSPEPSRSAWTILGRIENSCYATFAYGYFQASVVLFLPLDLVEEKGISREQTILVPAFFAAGMLLFSNFGGRFGDRYGHLGIMRILAVIGTTMILGFVFLDSFKFMALSVFVAGATLATISPLSLALQGVVVRPTEYPRANSMYNAFYATGMLLGPPISSAVFVRYGGGIMLYHLAALWCGFVVFSLVFFRDDPAAARGRNAAPVGEIDEPFA
ncbi:MAG: MFS transporter [Polyangiaceae bacterium]